jgi:hypothetical protein
MGKHLGIVYDQAMSIAPHARGDPTAPVDGDRLSDRNGFSIR